MASVAGAGLQSSKGGGGSGKYGNLKGYVPTSLLDSIAQDPKQSFDVIVQAGDRAENSHGFIQKILNDKSGSSDENLQSGNVKREFTSISGGQMTLTGKQILRMAKNGLASSIMPNETVTKQGTVLNGSATSLNLSNSQLWPWATGAPVDWTRQAPDAATIAVVDSGIQSRADFGTRLLGQINLASLGPNSPGDGYGHGTFVAGIAAGAAAGYAGAAPKAEILSLDVMNDQGQATVADVVKAADWILANKSTYNIKVANFSLHSVNRASVMFDPLDAAVERLWLNGVTVVAASGNYGTPGAPSGVAFAPGNDPFVITVGAADIGTGLGTSDDSVAPWSAYGYTGDGFWKPEIGAPGRYMVGPVPAGSQLTKDKPGNVVDPVKGYIQLSGTSFAAPVVSAAAAMLIAQHPTWGPDQVKGALMVTATPEPNVKGNALGVGDVTFLAARLYPRTPPNPNSALGKFVSMTTDGTKSFNAKAWQAAAKANAAWSDAAWSDVAWSDAAWSDAAWSDVAWADAAWASVAWGDAAWSDVAWSDAAWSDAAWADNTDAEPSGTDVADAAPTDQDALVAQLASAGLLDSPADTSSLLP